MPNQSVVLNKKDIKFASNVFGDFANGTLDYKHQPDVIELISKASKDQLVANYLVCVSVARGDVTTQEQKAHLSKRLDFMSGVPQPTPTEIAQWQENNPFPPPLDTTANKLIALQEKEIERLTKENESLKRREEAEKLEYAKRREEANRQK